MNNDIDKDCFLQNGTRNRDIQLMRTSQSLNSKDQRLDEFRKINNLAKSVVDCQDQIKKDSEC